MSKKQSNSTRLLTEDEKARRAYLREQKNLAKQYQIPLPGFDVVPFFPNLKGGKNDR